MPEIPGFLGMKARGSRFAHTTQTRSLRGERRRPLLDICGQSLFRVIALEQDLLILALNGECGFHWNLPACLHGALDAAHSLSGFVGRAELARILHDVLYEAVALVDVVDDAEFLGLFKGKRIASDHQLNRPALAHQTREALRPSGSRQNAQIHFGQADFPGVFARDADVSGHRDLETAANAMTVERR